MIDAMRRLYRNIIHMREDEAVVLMEGVFRVLREESRMSLMTEEDKRIARAAFDEADRCMDALGPAFEDYFDGLSRDEWEEKLAALMTRIDNEEPYADIIGEHVASLIERILFVMPPIDVVNLLKSVQLWLGMNDWDRPDWVAFLVEEHDEVDSEEDEGDAPDDR